MRGAVHGIEADGITIGAKKVYLGVYPPVMWGADWRMYAFVDGVETFKDSTVTMIDCMVRLGIWLDAFAISEYLDTTLGADFRKEIHNGR